LGEKDEFRMRAKELRRYHVVQKVLSEEMTQRGASELLGVSERQMRRIVRRVRREGERGVMHRGRGRPSNRRYGESLKRRVVRLYRGRYRGFGPTLANEKLRERDFDADAAAEAVGSGRVGTGEAASAALSVAPAQGSVRRDDSDGRVAS
jgi:hypothetical protein